MDIHRSSLRDFIIPSVKSVYVVDYYGGIQSQLEGKKDFPYKNFLAKPRVRTSSEIVWSSDVFLSRPRTLNECEGHQKQQYALLLSERVKAFEELISALQEEGGDALAGLLVKCLSYINETSVYCGEGEVVIVNWGLVPRIQGPESLGIYCRGKYLGHWDYLHNSRPEPEPIKPESTPEPIASEPIKPGFIEPEPLPEPIEPEPLPEPIEPEPLPEPIVPEPIEPDPVMPDPKKKQMQDSKRKRSFCRWINGWRHWLSKLLYLLLSLLLFLLLLFLLRNCEGGLHVINPFYSPLPDHSSIFPIDTTEIGQDEDSMKKILLDRLNILLEKENENTIDEFAKKFKAIYEGEAYKIVYYDRKTGRLQLKVPAKEREEIKKNLPFQLPEFHFMVYDETLFDTRVSFNDPMLSDSEYNWYLRVIQAFDAWDITTGSPEVIVAVVDNGFDLTHPELAGNIYRPYNTITRNASVFPVKGNDPHGTHVAATVVGNCNNHSGLSGIAPRCKLMPVQVATPDGFMPMNAIIDGILYAIYEGADVINLSLGTVFDERLSQMPVREQLNRIANTGKGEEMAWNYVFNIARERNCVIILAAGNENIVSGMDVMKRNRNTIRVSAVTPELEKADFSNYGVFKEIKQEYSTVSAPGVKIYSAAPGNSYEVLQGTSMAAPIVAGAVALMKSLNRNITAGQVINILQSTGRPVDYSIGNLIQLQDALLVLQGKHRLPGGAMDCDSIAQRARALQQELHRLKELCPGLKLKEDTLKYTDVVKNPLLLNGAWKSTTTLYNTFDGSPLELFMEFYNGDGQLIILNKGEKYVASLSASCDNGRVFFVQHGPAVSGQNSFMPYTYSCRPDWSGNLLCDAYSVQNFLSFYLVRMR